MNIAGVAPVAGLVRVSAVPHVAKAPTSSGGRANLAEAELQAATTNQELDIRRQREIVCHLVTKCRSSSRYLLMSNPCSLTCDLGRKTNTGHLKTAEESPT